MAKLLRIDRKLRTLGRRLTTDANGAPCCCQTSNECPCDPSLPLAPFPYVACIGGRFATFAGGSTLTLPSPPARIAVVRAQWELTQTRTEQSRDSLGTSIFDQVQRFQGSAQWCINRVGLQWSQAQWFLNNATSAFAQQTVGNRFQPYGIEETYEGNEALGYFPIFPNGDRGRFRPLIIQPNTAFYGNVTTGISVMVNPFLQIVLESQAQGDGSICGLTTNYRRASGSRTLVQSRRFQFASSPTQAAYTESINSSDSYTSGYSLRESINLAVVYTTRYLTCTTGGDPTGSLLREPGCANCFDASMLEAM